MKKSVMLVALLLMMSTVMFAQRGHRRGVPNKAKATPEAMAARRADRMKAEVSLNDDQYTKVKAIYLKFAESQSKVRQDTTLTKEASRAETKKLMDASEAEIKTVLTPEQQTKWAEFRKTQRDQRGGRRGKGGAGDDSDKKK